MINSLICSDANQNTYDADWNWFKAYEFFIIFVRNAFLQLFVSKLCMFWLKRSLCSILDCKTRKKQKNISKNWLVTIVKNGTTKSISSIVDRYQCIVIVIVIVSCMRIAEGRRSLSVYFHKLRKRIVSQHCTDARY